jgi:DNA-binding NtrC family response regulator
MEKTVLLVDDDTQIINSLRRNLRKEPYKIICTNSAESAIKYLKVIKVDIVVADEMMYGMSGSELLQCCKQHFPAIKRILFTGSSQPELLLKSINQTEVFRYLTKPCSYINLAIAIREAIDDLKYENSKHQLFDEGPVTTKNQSFYLDDKPEYDEIIAKYKDKPL